MKLNTTSKKAALSIALAALATTAMTGVSAAATCPDGYPSETVVFWVGYGAGGGTDAIARALADSITQQTGWNIVVDNKPGAGGGVMAAQLKGAKPDGLTIGVNSTDAVALNPVTNPEIGYVPSDFVYAASTMRTMIGLVALTDKPYDTLDEFAAWAKENGGATVSVAGVNQEIAIKEIGKHYGVELTPIPGKGAADALQSALGGHVDATTQGTQHIAQIKAGNMVQLAAMTRERVPYDPDSKTVGEYGIPTATMNAYTQIMLPKETPADIVTCIAEVVDEALEHETFQTLMTNFDNVSENMGSEALTQMIMDDNKKYQDLLAK